MSDKTGPFRFTNDNLKAIQPPTTGRKYYRDDEVRGFILDVASTGTKTFRLLKKIDGKPVRLFIARFDGRNTTAARSAAKQKAGKLAAGEQVESTERDHTRGLTVGEFFETWLERHAKPHRPGTWRHDQQLFDTHIKQSIGNRPLIEIRTQHIRDLHAHIAATIQQRRNERDTMPGAVPASGSAGWRTANRMLQLVSIMFECARQWEVYTLDNPTIGVRRFRENKREEYLKQHEAPRFFKALMATETAQDARDFIGLSLFTGARRANVMAMRWADVSLEAALWTIPGESTKTGRAYHIPLSPPAVAILVERHGKLVDGIPWVFPADSASGHLVSFQKQWAEFRKRAGFPHLHLHDLRHTLASWQAIDGTSLAIIGRGLGHSSPNTTSRYAHINVDPVRVSMDRAAVAMLQAAGPAEPNKATAPKKSARGVGK